MSGSVCFVLMGAVLSGWLFVQDAADGHYSLGPRPTMCIVRKSWPPRRTTADLLDGPATHVFKRQQLPVIFSSCPGLLKSRRPMNFCLFYFRPSFQWFVLVRAECLEHGSAVSFWYYISEFSQAQSRVISPMATRSMVQPMSRVIRVRQGWRAATAHAATE